MAIPFYSNIDLTKNQILNAVMQLLASDPSSPTEGQMYYNNSTHYFMVHNGTAFVNVQDAVLLNGQNAAYYRSRTNHTGTQTASTISDFNTQVRTSTLNQMAAPTGSLSMNSQKITNVTDGTAPQDAATVAQLQAAMDGIRKTSVRAATTANIAISTALNNGDTLDGVTLVTGDRVLVKDQSAPEQNGIYIVGPSPARATDMDAANEIDGTQTIVEDGTVNVGTSWYTTSEVTTLGTDAIAWTQRNDVNALIGGSGLTKTGNTLDVNVDNSSIEIASDIIRVKAGGIADAMLSSTFCKKFTQTLTGGSTSEVVTHNLNTRAVIIDVSLIGTPYTNAGFEIEKTSVNTITVKSGNANIAASTWLITIIG